MTLIVAEKILNANTTPTISHRVYSLKAKSISICKVRQIFALGWCCVLICSKSNICLCGLSQFLRNLVPTGLIVLTLCCIVYISFSPSRTRTKNYCHQITNFIASQSFLLGHLALRRKVQQVCSPANGSLKVQFI